MAEPAFHSVTVSSVRPVAAGLVEVVLDTSGSDLEDAHTVPGQYVQVQAAGRTGYFAVTSPPGAGPRLDLLVRTGAAVADALAGAAPGAPVPVTAPLGRGFPVDDYRGMDLLLFATGSGISAIRSVILHVVRRRADWRRVVLFFGARTANAFAYEDELDHWRSRDVEVHLVASRPEPGTWAGLTGYVQHHLDRLGPDLGGAVACLAGVQGMNDEVRALVLERGLAPEHVLTNY